MNLDILLGLQWGDEGKGKIVDVITPYYDVIARFQGGPNAGHTLEFNGIKHVLHIIPSAIFHPEKINIIGNGVVIDPVVFKQEIDELLEMGLNPADNLFISKKAHLILPTHKLMDAALERKKGNKKIGSTLKGIGPTYTDKTARNGLRINDIISSNFEEKLYDTINYHKDLLDKYEYGYAEQLPEMMAVWIDALHTLKQFTFIDSEYEINCFIKEGKKVLAEGAQGTLLDVDFGSYPYVTSSNTVAAGACIGLGVPPTKTGKIIGIVKAYCTRVGGGPFPTELLDETGEKLRSQGNEYGATTGRSRRCGWLDLVALKYAVMINGVSEIILTKADVMSDFDIVKVCTAYKINGEKTTRFPVDIDTQIEPVFTSFNGWKQDISSIKTFDELPNELKTYIEFIENEVGIKFTIISTGPDRKETIIR